MIRVLGLARWEWFKLQRSKMPWILLAILLGFTQLAVWGSYVAYSNTAASGGRVLIPRGVEPSGRRTMTCSELPAESAALPAALVAGFEEQCRRQRDALARQHQALSPVGGATSALGIFGSLGLILFAILTASVVGSEFALGTLRPILSRGTGRLSFLAGKYATLVTIAVVAAIAFSAAGALSGLLAARSALPLPFNAAGLALGDSPFPPLVMSFAKNVGALIAFITVTGAVTLLLRSTAAGMAISLAWFAGEALLIRLLSAVFGNFDVVADFLPMRNISALTSTRANIPPFASGSEIGPAQASLVVAAYALVFAVIAALVFRRRDIAGAAGS